MNCPFCGRPIHLQGPLLYGSLQVCRNCGAAVILTGSQTVSTTTANSPQHALPDPDARARWLFERAMELPD